MIECIVKSLHVKKGVSKFHGRFDNKGRFHGGMQLWVYGLLWTFNCNRICGRLQTHLFDLPKMMQQIFVAYGRHLRIHLS